MIVVAASFGISFLRQSAAPTVIAAGSFHQVAHKGSGTAEIIKRNDGHRVLVLKEFQTADKPDLYVYLISAPDALENEAVKNSEIYSLGLLKRTNGSQEYLLPGDLDPSRYNAVTIWSRRHEINFTTAPLKRPDTDRNN